MPEIDREIAVFLHAFLMGVIMFAGYSVCESLRHIFPHKQWMIHIEDVIYWGCMSVYLFVQNYHTNNGEIRWFSTLGIVFGALLLWKFFSFVKKLVKKIYMYVGQKFRKNP